MKSLISITIFVLGISNVSGQISAATEKFALPANLSESSGVIYYNGKIITHNDSGNPNELYEMVPTSSTITRTVTLSGATNVDWEDITQDDNYIYIGDIGNNSGDRTDLKIYKISKAAYNASTSVSAETINFSYANQSDFTSNPQATPWDAETLISIDANNLLIISKNWNTHVAQAYLVSKTPGTYVLSPLASTLSDVTGNGDLITGGTYNPLTNIIFLIGYTSNTSTLNVLRPFIYECSGFSGSNVFSGTNTRYDISGPSLGNFSYEQTEGIAYADANTYYVTSEAFDTGYGVADYSKLIEVTTNDTALSTTDFKSGTIQLYPNPVSEKVHIKSLNTVQVEVYNMQDQRLLKTTTNSVDMSAFSPGMYLFKITLNDWQVVLKKVLKY